MGLIEVLGHLWHAMAPAVFVGSLLWGMLRLRRDQGGCRAAWAAWALLVMGGVLVLAAVWAFEGHDGRMLAYAAMVVVQGGLATWLRRR